MLNPPGLSGEPDYAHNNTVKLLKYCIFINIYTNTNVGTYNYTMEYVSLHHNYQET